MKKIVEIRAAEGGKDSQLFVHDLAEAYFRLADRAGWKREVLDTSPHQVRLAVSGRRLDNLEMEAGGHRIQRVPPTEKRGRVHTSTVTVAVLDPAAAHDAAFDRRSDDDFSIEWFSGTGKGGQHRNKHQNSCRVTHLPTGLSEARQGRHREANLRDARAALDRRLDSMAQAEADSQQAQSRRSQVGSGMRGDKTVTIRFQDDKATHHVTGRTIRASKYMRGFMDELWR